MQAEADMDFADAEDIEKVREALSNVAFSEDPYIRSVQQACVDALLTPEASAAEWEGLIIDALNAQLDALGSFSSEGDRIDFANVVKYSGSMETTLLRAMCQSKDEYPIEAVSRNEDATMGRIKERTIRFDPDSARDLLAPGQDPFWAHISDVVRESLVSHGVRVESLEVDGNGIKLKLKNLVVIQGKTNWDDFSDSEKQETKNLALLVGLLYEMCKTPLVLKSSDEKGMNKVNDMEIKRTINNAEMFLEERQLY